MHPPQRDQVATLLADIVREALARGEAIDVPGLGTFAVAHRSSQIEKQPDGEVIMRPPRDEVVFTPEP